MEFAYIDNQGYIIDISQERREGIPIIQGEETTDDESARKLAEEIFQIDDSENSNN